MAVGSTLQTESAPPGLRGLLLCCSRHSQRLRGGAEGGRGGGGRCGSCGDQEQQSEGQSERKRQKGLVPEGKAAGSLQGAVAGAWLWGLECGPLWAGPWCPWGLESQLLLWCRDMWTKGTRFVRAEEAVVGSPGWDWAPKRPCVLWSLSPTTTTTARAAPQADTYFLAQGSDRQAQCTHSWAHQRPDSQLCEVLKYFHPTPLGTPSAFCYPKQDLPTFQQLNRV